MQSLRQMRQFVKEGRIDPIIIEAARGICLMSAQKNTLAEIDALFRFVRDRVRYVHDVLDTETISPAWYTLHTRSGDCDDKAVLLASLLEAIEIPTRFIVAGYTSDAYEHVYLMACIDDDICIEMDPTEPNGLGWSPPDPTVRYVEKLDSEKSILEKLLGR